MLGTAPGSSGTCGAPGFNLCTPGADIATNFPPAPLLPAPTTYPYGLMPGDVVNSASRGIESFTGPERIRFSVDALSTGAAGAVLLQAGAGEAQADIFYGGTFALPLLANTLAADGDGLPAAAPPALGLVEASGGPPPFDDLSVLSSCRPFPLGHLLFYTLAPGSPGLTPLGAGPADILVGFMGAVSLYIPAATLGLLPGDVIDALAFRFMPTPLAIFSLAPGSPSLALIGAGAGDLLGSGPVVVIAGAALGLAPADNLDAVDIALDPDNDIVASGCDNCAAVANSDQANADSDAFGDACDTCTDTDGDGFGTPGFPANTCPTDNCPLVSNPSQADADGDGAGDECDVCALGDDGLDADGDTIPNACDMCPGFDDASPGNPCPKLFGLEYDGSLLRILNPLALRTLSSVPVALAGETIISGKGLAFHPTTGTLYALLELSGQPGYELVTLNPATGAATSVGDTTDRFWGLTLDCAGTLYAVTDDVAGTISLIPETLYTLNKTTAAPTLFLTLGNGDIGEGIAFRPLDGRIYHTSGHFNQVFESIDPQTLAITNITLLGNSGLVHAITYWEAQDVFVTQTGFSTSTGRITPGGIADDHIGTWGEDPPYVGLNALAFSGLPAACAPKCAPAPLGGCDTPQKSRLLVKDKGEDGAGASDKLIWKWLKGPLTVQGDFGDPTATADYTLCLYAGPGAALALEASLPAGGTCAGSDCWAFDRYQRLRLLEPGAGPAGHRQDQAEGRCGGEGEDPRQGPRRRAAAHRSDAAVRRRQRRDRPAPQWRERELLAVDLPARLRHAQRRRPVQGEDTMSADQGRFRPLPRPPPFAEVLTGEGTRRKDEEETMRTSVIALAVATTLHVTPAFAGSPLLGTSPGSSGTCGAPGSQPLLAGCRRLHQLPDRTAEPHGARPVRLAARRRGQQRVVGPRLVQRPGEDPLLGRQTVARRGRRRRRAGGGRRGRRRHLLERNLRRSASRQYADRRRRRPAGRRAAGDRSGRGLGRRPAAVR